jgi:sulfur-oxidizing protein SoxY
MERDPTPRPVGLSRRGFLGLASAAVGLWIRPAWAARPGAGRAPPGPGPPSSLEREHVPVLHVPGFTRNGAKVPIVIEMTHPMAPDHHITSIHVANDGDPISSKGTFHFTPENGHVQLSFQARMHHGISQVTATAECNLHGKFSTSQPIEIPEGAGGCTGAGPTPVGRTRGDDIRAPVIRIPELVERGRIQRGEIIHVQVKMRHPNRTGLVFRDGAFVQESEPLHLDDMEVHYAGERVSWFSMTPALSDDPFIGFTLLARREGTLRVLLTNNQGEKFEATHEIRLS